jgi:hypothetical protein
MSTNIRVVTLAQAAALFTSLLIPGASGAWAQQANLEQIYHVGQNSDFGAQQDAAVRGAAAAPSSAPLTAAQQKALNKEFRVGQNNDFGADQNSQSVLSQRSYQSRVASTVPMVGGKRDLVGGGGQQDELANEIYQPGQNNDFGANSGSRNAR